MPTQLPSVVLFVMLLTLLPATSLVIAADQPDEILRHANEPWTGDLDGMTKRGFLRILTAHNPLFFTFDGDGKQGIIAEVSKELDKHLAEEIGRVRSLTIIIIPVSRDEMIPSLIEGRGDIIMGNLTITPERQKLVEFSPPIYPNVEELVITGPASGKISSFDDLVETGLYVRRSSSYFEHLLSLNADRVAQGKPPIPITEANESLEDYDLLDMLNAGILKAIVVDSHKVAYWQKIYDKIVVHHDLSVHSGNQIAWAIRKDSPQLAKSIASFAKTVRKGTLLGNIIIKRHLGNTNRMKKLLAGDDQKPHQETIDLIRRFSEKYEFDWQIIAALAFQESGFDQTKKSRVGAIGVMQVLPSTAADKAVNIPDISSLENNVHAGVKYLHWLNKTYYSNPDISALDQVLFSFAAYNAGPGNMRKARRRAKSLGFDPNQWFGNVEIGMYRAVSGEPASYVRNIYKYYIAYQGLEGSRVAREKALQEPIEQ